MNGEDKNEMTEVVKLAIENSILSCPKGKSIEKRLRVMEFVLIGLLVSIFGMNGYSLLLGLK